MPETRCHLAPLPSLAAIAVTGNDAADFLAAQLSQAPPAAGAAQAPLGAWHDAKGRVQALFRVVRNDGGYLLITHSSVANDVATSLRRYILRADVMIDVAADLSCRALLGESTPWLAEQGIDLGIKAGATAQVHDAVWLRLGPTLVQVLSPSTAIEQIARDLPSGSEDDAELMEIGLGLPTISTQLRGQFLPQMLNLDVLGGVAFDKGCYPGQEIIARAQNLGTVKRRMLRFAIDGPPDLPEAGSALISGPDQTVGIVVRSARSEDCVELLAVVRLEAAQDSLTCEGIADATLELGILPYELPGAD